jgi:hypothetical protein
MSSIGLADKAKKWESVIQYARKSIGEFNLSMFLHVDLYGPEANKGSGFYVDEKEGLVLTTKHCVGPAPFFGVIVFEGNFEVCSWPKSHPFCL